MPTYMLDGTGKATLPRRPITVMVNVEGDPTGVQLQALREDRPDPSAVIPQRSLMVLPHVEARTVVRVVPGAGSQAFSTPTIVHVTLGVDSRNDPDAERAVLTAVDVSGLTYWDLASVEPAGDRLVVTSLKPVADERLGELGTQARVSARRILGADKLRDDRAFTIVLAVDTSASMTAVIGDGTVQAALELLTGVAEVIAGGKEIRVCLLAEPAQWLPAVAAAELGGATVRALQASGPVTGFRAVTARTATPVAQEATLTYLVTDGVPADLAALEGASDGAANTYHLVSLISVGAWEVQQVSSSVPATQIPPPPPGARADEHLLRSPGAIDAVVAGLLADGALTGVLR